MIFQKHSLGVSRAAQTAAMLSTDATEYFANNTLYGMGDVGPYAHKYPVLGQQIPHQDQPFVNHGDKGVRALAPDVAVGDLFQDIGLLGEGVVADLDGHGEIRAYVKGWINVNQLETALFFYLLAQRAVLQGRQDQLVVAPDEFVGPPLKLTTPARQKANLAVTRPPAFRRAARRPAR